MTLTPAYGRDYKSAKAVREDFLAGKDFVIADFVHPDSGRYVSVTELAGREREVYIRYCRLTKMVVVKVPDRDAQNPQPLYKAKE